LTKKLKKYYFPVFSSAKFLIHRENFSEGVLDYKKWAEVGGRKKRS
jgi:hypothetical protein